MKHQIEAIQDAFEALSEITGHKYLATQLHKVLTEMRNQDEHLLPNWEDMDKPIMCIDFDGVISQYKNGWRGVGNLAEETPVDGAIKFLNDAVKHFTVLIFSSRCNAKSGILAIEKWLIMYGLSSVVLDKLIFQPGKPSYHVVIDDRAFKFSGKFPSIGHFIEFKPWYYDKEGWR